MPKAIILANNDNVATAIDDIKKGDVCNVFKGNKNLEIIAKNDIPFGHKISLNDFSEGVAIIK